MPRGQLTKEIYLQQSVTRLKQSNAKLREENKLLQSQMKIFERRIFELEVKLQDKEFQRKQLLSYLYKPNRETGEAKKLGKKQGARGYQRPKPKDKDVTEFREFPLSLCTSCESPLGKPVDTVIKYEEDIDLAPRKVIKNTPYQDTGAKNAESLSVPPVFPR